MNSSKLDTTRDAACRRSPTVAGEREGETAILVEVSLRHWGHGVSRVMVIGTGSQRSLVCPENIFLWVKWCGAVVV
jgi:hypothetical protein